MALLLACGALRVDAATVYVAAGGNLQAALNAAAPGDTILLAEGAEFVGNFVLPVKPGDAWITVRTAAPDTVLPPSGVRIRPADAPRLARLRSPNAAAALRTAPGAHHWALRYLEFGANHNGYGDILQIGDGSSAQNTLARVPQHLVLSHLYVHGHPSLGQKRCIALNAAHVVIADSYVADCKAVSQDAQAIGGWNGPGPYTIENNYLEASGENVLFGGADPAIPELVADGITVRRNHLTRPMSWRDPIIATPAGITASAEAGGSLAAGSYSYRIVARGPVGQGVTARSTASPEIAVTASGPANAIRLRWQPVVAATEYRVYGRAAGSLTMFWRVTGTEFVDTGASGTAENVPTTTGTVWSVKNLFELKNARNVVVEGNVLENHWRESQPGYAIVLTPRNSNGACTWCVVEHVRFEYNLVRNVAAGINLTGYDIPSRPTRQSNNILFRQNLFTGVSTKLGGNAWFLLVGDEPRDLVLEHNTIDSNGATVMNVYGGTSTDPREILGFRMTANAARHGTYGINGSSFAYGNGILDGYFPGALFAANYLAGGLASRYPTGNLFAGPFEDQFAGTAGADYTLRAGSLLAGAAPDGSGIGVDYRTLQARIAGVQEGMKVEDGIMPVALAAVPVGPAAGFTWSCDYTACQFADASLAGSASLVSATWDFGDGTQGAGGHVVHSFPAGGSYTVTLTVVDAGGLRSSSSKSLVVEAMRPPSAGFTLACTYLDCTFADASSAGSAPITTWSWSFTDGGRWTTPAGSWSFAAAGTYTMSLTVTDARGLSSSVSKTVSVEPPNRAPEASFAASCIGMVCTFTDTSRDSDGTVTLWIWSFDTGQASSGRTTSFTYPAAGTYAVTLTVVDDDGAKSSSTQRIEVTGRVHVALSGASRPWESKKGGAQYWSTDVTVAVHGSDERPVGGATVLGSWSGAVTRDVSCVTNAAGLCTFGSGRLSRLRGTVTFTVSSVSAPAGVYEPSSNHDAAGAAAGAAITIVKP